MSARSFPEAAVQVAFFKAWRAAGPLNAIAFAVPNGERTSAARAMKARAMGVTPGAPDVVVIIAGRPLLIEFKAPGRAARLSPDQRAFADVANSAECSLFVLDSVKEALQYCIKYGVAFSRPPVLGGS